MKTTTLTAFSVMAAVFAVAQKKPIDHTVYDEWKSIQSEQVSDNGKAFTYEINPGEGDGYLYIRDVETGAVDSIVRGDAAQFGGDARWVVFEVEPGFDTVRTLKLDGVKSKDLPKDSLGIWITESDSLIKYANVKSFDAAEHGEWVAIYLNDEDQPEERKRKFRLFCKKKNRGSKIESEGKTLVLFNPGTGEERRINRVTDYKVNEKRGHIAWVEEFKVDTLDSAIVKVFDPVADTTMTVYRGTINVKRLTFDERAKNFAFLATDDTAKNKVYSLYHWVKGRSRAFRIADSTSGVMPEGWAPSEFGYLSFSKSGERLYFGAGEMPENPEEDTLLDSEKAKVDVWSWHDDRLQPQQLLRKKSDEHKNYKMVFHVETGDIVQLESQEMESVRTTNNGDGDYALGTDPRAYERTYSWSMPWKRDYYVVDVRTGERTTLLLGQGHSVDLSPDGEYVTWYIGKDSVWVGMKAPSGEPKELTSDLRAVFSRDNNGSPYIAGDLGNAGWTTDGRFIAYSEYDVWVLDPTGERPPLNLTHEAGEKTRTRYRLINMDWENPFTDIEGPLYLSAFNELSKKGGYYWLHPAEGVTTPEPLIIDEHAYSYLRKAKDAEVFYYERSSFKEAKNLWMAQEPDLSDTKQITDANPQQDQYLWGDVQLVEWTNYKGEEREGLLYTPEDLDTNATGEYPMIVYFYEKYTDRIHTHYAPRPTASIVYPTEYVSNGYVIFIPNIHYTPGHPGKSAYDDIMSGTDAMLEQFTFIDSTKLGLQGQSWGGYQTAYLVTQTDRYEAAMAGAPVSNMTSAYGGIRWGSGLSRMFQYERTQSRIGATLWDSLDLYIENSPIFFAPNVETPLLIMHNDKDGAVPWYQGIEYFVALRRLEKKVWMLNYNGDAHNLRRRANKVDLSIRMRQFFDHYLMDQAVPEWMEKGVPATDKGVDYGYELIED